MVGQLCVAVKADHCATQSANYVNAHIAWNIHTYVRTYMYIGLFGLASTH